MVVRDGCRCCDTALMEQWRRDAVGDCGDGGGGRGVSLQVAVTSVIASYFPSAA